MDSRHDICASNIIPRLTLHKLVMGDGIYIHQNGNRSDDRKRNLIPIRGYKNSGKTFLNGYIAIYYPEHKRAFENGCVYEHILVAEKMLGRALTVDECVHHKDRDRTNNNASNLMIFATNQDHITYHAGGEAILQDNGVYKTNPLTVKSIYNNRTKKDIDNHIADPGSITIINKMKYALCPVCKTNLKSVDAVMCKSCRCQDRRKHIPQKNELEKLIYNTPFTKIGEFYGVTDNAVRKWCKSYGLPFRKKDLDEYQSEVIDFVKEKTLKPV